jgi:hypothetical protein
VHLTAFLAGFYPVILAGFYAADYTRLLANVGYVVSNVNHDTEP